MNVFSKQIYGHKLIMLRKKNSNFFVAIDKYIDDNTCNSLLLSYGNGLIILRLVKIIIKLQLISMKTTRIEIGANINALAQIKKEI